MCNLQAIGIQIIGVLFFLQFIFADESKDSDSFDFNNTNEVACYDYPQADNYDVEWFKKADAEGWRYVMGSRSHLSLLNLVLTGKEAKGADDVRKACFRITRDEVGFRLYGHGNVADYKCKNNGTRHRTCKPTDKSTNIKWASLRAPNEATIVATDNENYAVGFRCSKDGFTVWSLRAKAPSVSPVIVAKVMALLQGKSFKTEMAVPLANENCLDSGDAQAAAEGFMDKEPSGGFSSGKERFKGGKKSGKYDEKDQEKAAKKSAGPVGDILPVPALPLNLLG